MISRLILEIARFGLSRRDGHLAESLNLGLNAKLVFIAILTHFHY